MRERRENEPMRRENGDAGIADAGFASQEWQETRGLRSSADARKRGRGFCVASKQKRAERVKGLPRRGGEIRVRKVLARKNPSSTRFLAAPDEGKFGPNPKGGYRP